jgi:hypothetical protein
MDQQLGKILHWPTGTKPLRCRDSGFEHRIDVRRTNRLIDNELREPDTGKVAIVERRSLSERPFGSFGEAAVEKDIARAYPRPSLIAVLFHERSTDIDSGFNATIVAPQRARQHPINERAVSAFFDSVPERRFSFQWFLADRNQK